jgi:hypothetical protein
LLLEFAVTGVELFDLGGKLRQRPLKRVHSRVELSPIISALGGSHAGHQENGQHVAGQKAASLARTHGVSPRQVHDIIAEA